jgi:chemotaxis protein MotA
MLYKDIRLTVQRHEIGQSVFKGMGDSAPAFGMIGTLIGLVQMLASMDDPASIGPSMAVALLTTLYGAVIANFICMPLADKLSLRSEQEQLNKSIIVEGAIGINRGVSPMVLEESLKIFLSPKERDKEVETKPAAEEAAN